MFSEIANHYDGIHFKALYQLHLIILEVNEANLVQIYGKIFLLQGKLMTPMHL